MKGFVEPLREIISSGERLHEIGEILHEGWKLKRNLSNLITSPEIDNNYKIGIWCGVCFYWEHRKTIQIGIHTYTKFPI